MALQLANEQLHEWQQGHVCEVYSRSEKKWIPGKVIAIFSDAEGKWVKVRYGRMEKEVDPNSNEIRRQPQNAVISEANDVMTPRKRKIGAQCELYSNEERQWLDGEIMHSFTDITGEWYRVKYGQRIRDVLSDDPLLRMKVTPKVAITKDAFERLKGIAISHPDLAPILEGILQENNGILDGDMSSS